MRFWPGPSGDARIGVLLANLGTPDAPSPAALRRYLREFLSDPRVVEAPRLLWWLILNLVILRVRPKRSARLYRTVWTDEGSPLLATTRRQATALAAELVRRSGADVLVEAGMRYGRPSIASGLRRLAEKDCARLLVLPAYPQYAAATTGSTFDAVARELSRWRSLPELRMVRSYHDHPRYITALASSVRDAWSDGSPPAKLILSFHGIPQRYADAGDPYPGECWRTARLVTSELDLPRRRWALTFQSRFGRERWLTPYNDRTLETLGRKGFNGIDVVCPGFSADCLETLEEIAVTNREIFERAGGTGYRYIPALNARPEHIAALADVVSSHLAGWT
jgi:protoporphyrin/coproporphyrin ferrochelatase